MLAFLQTSTTISAAPSVKLRAVIRDVSDGTGLFGTSHLIAVFARRFGELEINCGRDEVPATSFPRR
jgi:hypothetical protein